MKEKNVLFLVVDGLRADRCRNGGMTEPYSAPFVRHLCQKGTYFTNAISATSFTTPSIASMMTGVYPFVHGIEWFSGYKLNPKLKTLPEILRKAGYHTYAIVTGPLRLTELGLDRGFDEHIYRQENESIYAGLRRRLKKYIENVKKPWFLFVHLWELHYPICIPSSFKTKYQLSKYKYDKAFSCLNQQLMKIFSGLDLDENIIILTGDHGERLPGTMESIQRNLLTFLPYILRIPRGRPTRKFLNSVFAKTKRHLPGLHERQGHGFGLSDTLVKVPLFIAGNGFSESKVVDVSVSHVDILPTVLDSLGILHYLDEKIHGISLLEDGLPERVMYIGPAGGSNIKTYWIEGLRTRRWKYISRFNKDEPIGAYNLEDDPEERENLVSTRIDIIERFRGEMKKMKADRPSFTLRMGARDEKIIESRLKDLGYL